MVSVVTELNSDYRTMSRLTASQIMVLRYKIVLAVAAELFFILSFCLTLMTKLGGNMRVTDLMGQRFCAGS